MKGGIECEQCIQGLQKEEQHDRDLLVDKSEEVEDERYNETAVYSGDCEVHAVHQHHKNVNENAAAHIVR